MLPGRWIVTGHHTPWISNGILKSDKGFRSAARLLVLHISGYIAKSKSSMHTLRALPHFGMPLSDFTNPFDIKECGVRVNGFTSRHILSCIILSHSCLWRSNGYAHPLQSRAHKSCKDLRRRIDWGTRTNATDNQRLNKLAASASTLQLRHAQRTCLARSV